MVGRQPFRQKFFDEGHVVLQAEAELDEPGVSIDAGRLRGGRVAAGVSSSACIAGAVLGEWYLRSPEKA
jgi:hypothetical protein